MAVSRSPEKGGNLLPGIKLAACDVLDEGRLEKLLQTEAPYDILITAATGGSRAIGPFLEVSWIVFCVWFPIRCLLKNHDLVDGYDRIQSIF